jgi:hypothetical protein
MPSTLIDSHKKVIPRRLGPDIMHKTSDNWRKITFQKQHLPSNSGEYLDRSFENNCQNNSRIKHPFEVAAMDCNQTYIENSGIINHLPFIDLKGKSKKFRPDIGSVCSEDKHISYISNNKRRREAAKSFANPPQGKSSQRGKGDCVSNLRSFKLNSIHYEVADNRENSSQLSKQWPNNMNLQYYNFNENEHSGSPRGERCAKSKMGRVHQNKTSMNFYIRKSHNNNDLNSPNIENNSDANSSTNIKSIKECSAEEEADNQNNEANQQISPYKALNTRVSQKLKAIISGHDSICVLTNFGIARHKFGEGSRNLKISNTAVDKWKEKLQSYKSQIDEDICEQSSEEEI